MNILLRLLFNSWTKTLVILLVCFFSTYYIISLFAENFISFFNWKNKEFWKVLAIVVPSLILFPSFLNTFFFLKFIQIADNTKKITKLLEQQQKLLEQILTKNKQNQ